MAFHQVVLFAVFACLVAALPQQPTWQQPPTLDRSSWQLTSTVVTTSVVKDGNQQTVGIVNSTTVIYNCPNITQEIHKLVADRVRNKLASFPVDSEPVYDGLSAYQQLPKVLNMTETMVETTSYAPRTWGLAVMYHLDVWAKKKHRADVLAALKDLSF